SGIGIPASLTISSSRSINTRSVLSASFRPQVVLPLPMKPIRKIGLVSLILIGFFEIPVVYRVYIRQRIIMTFFDHCDVLYNIQTRFFPILSFGWACLGN